MSESILPHESLSSTQVMRGIEIIRRMKQKQCLEQLWSEKQPDRLHFTHSCRAMGQPGDQGAEVVVFVVSKVSHVIKRSIFRNLGLQS